MPEDKKREGSGSSELKSFDWFQPTTPVPEFYTNYMHLNWSLQDVRILFGQLKPEFGTSANFGVAERAAVSMSWIQAKTLMEQLTALIGKYEEANGELTRPKLADKP